MDIYQWNAAVCMSHANCGSLYYDARRRFLWILMIVGRNCALISTLNERGKDLL